MADISSVLITGGNGNLGRLVARLFEDHGTRVIAFDLPGTETAGAPTGTSRTHIAGDIRDTDLLTQTIDTYEPDAIIHLASLLSGSSETDPAAAWQINATASIDLMQCAAARGSGPFVFASTIATYGPGLPAHLPPDAPQWPQNVYGATKVAVERMGHWLKVRQGLDFRCLRFPMVLSPFAPPGALTAYPSHAFAAAARGAPFAFPVGPDTGMSTLYLDDVTRALHAITRAPRAQMRHPAYNLHGFHATAADIAAAIRARVPGAALSFDPDAAVDALIAGWPDTMDDTAARDDWGWQPAFDLAATADALLGP